VSLVRFRSWAPLKSNIFCDLRASLKGGFGHGFGPGDARGSSWPESLSKAEISAIDSRGAAARGKGGSTCCSASRHWSHWRSTPCARSTWTLCRIFRTPRFTPHFFLKLLAHELRWRLIEALAQSDRRVQELVALVGEPHNLVSYHLRQLRDQALVAEHRSAADGRDIYYSLDLDRLKGLYFAAGERLHPGISDRPHAATLPTVKTSPPFERIAAVMAACASPEGPGSEPPKGRQAENSPAAGVQVRLMWWRACTDSRSQAGLSRSRRPLPAGGGGGTACWPVVSRSWAAAMREESPSGSSKR
jgi:DNA-binding transcriptional ArsR family regulator